MDNFKKIDKTICPHCSHVIREVETSYDLPPEILAIVKQMGINIKDFGKY
jgi:hypothetical protein